MDTGLTGEADLLVGAADTAAALGSGEIDVLGTPRVLALAEAATVAALAGRLDGGDTTVGTRVELTHLRATPVGAKVHAAAVLRESAGRRLVFDVVVSSDGAEAARCTIERVVVDRERFLANARA
ncbi:thioesterase superfamily protein [Murinocardiopsis flavida]|uniref:Thioesterase superfamily protein n=1 Tax=Murinocardiopsis flavida TaxID=645275 RepID=A0A2P8DJL7_9ACTN|nr:thioesterase [Murinocardiopsis flavida]PSK97423.1 thioesterase superfamily protein [Murinocardiopsis flavida]